MYKGFNGDTRFLPTEEKAFEWISRSNFSKLIPLSPTLEKCKKALAMVARRFKTCARSLASGVSEQSIYIGQDSLLAFKLSTNAGKDRRQSFLEISTQ